MVKDQTRVRNRAQTQDIYAVKRQTKALRTLVERQIAELGKDIATLIPAQRNTARRWDILRSILVVGAVSAAAMMNLVPELGNLNRKKVACLAGLAPITLQSGQWQGKAFITGGRKPLRNALYARSCRYALQPDLKAKYQALRATGKSAKVAIVAVMRKRIEMANARVKADRRCMPNALDQYGYSGLTIKSLSLVQSAKPLEYQVPRAECAQKIAPWTARPRDPQHRLDEPPMARPASHSRPRQCGAMIAY